MKIKTMDKMLLEIYHIKNLESIKIWDLHASKDNKLVVIPAILINYDGGKTLNLCAKDEYFDVYVKKVVEVYNDEKNNILEDSLTDPFHLRTSIIIDEHSKKILESGILENINSMYSFYDNKGSYDNSLLFMEDELSTLEPILLFSLKKIFGLTNRIITFDSKLTGYRNRGIISGKVDGVYKDFSVSYEKVNENTYEFAVSGFDDTNGIILMKIEFLNNALDISATVPKYNISGSYGFFITNGTVKEIESFSKDGIPVSYKNNDLEEVECEIANIANLDHDMEVKYYKLPWNGFMGINSKVMDVSDEEKIVEVFNLYLYGNDKTFVKRESYSKQYKHKDTTEVFGISVELDRMDKRVIGLLMNKKEGIYFIETAFLDVMSPSGYYATNLENKYFYHGVISKDKVKGIKRDGLRSISKEDEIIENVDVLNDTKLLSLVRGE